MADDAEPLTGEKSSSEAAPSIASESDLGIQYCVVARADDSVVLVEGNVREGNQHVLLAQQVLQSGQVSREGKRSVPLKSGNYYFHALTEDGLWRTVIAYSTTFVPFSDTIVAGLKAYSDMKYGDSLVAENFRKIDDVKTTQKVAVDKLVERGQAIDELVKNADGLQDSSTTLKVNAMKVEEAMKKRNRRIWMCCIITGVVVLILAIIVISVLAGGGIFGGGGGGRRRGGGGGGGSRRRWSSGNRNRQPPPPPQPAPTTTPASQQQQQNIPGENPRWTND